MLNEIADPTKRQVRLVKFALFVCGYGEGISGSINAWWKVLKCDAGGGWKRSVGLIM
jgi:hypothetical protein